VEFYLVACEMLFRNGPLMVFHLQLAKRRDAVPLTRDYVTAFDRSVPHKWSRREDAVTVRREADIEAETAA
jgi:hypothetical protein